VGDPEGLGWVGRVAVAAWAAGLPLTAYNLGVRREPSVAVVARWAVEARPRIAPGTDSRVVFSFGANDTTFEVGRERVPPDDGVRALDAALGHAAGLGLPALVVGPPPVGDDGQAERITALSGRFAEACASRRVPYVPVVEDLRRDGPWLAEARAGDGAHPGAGGYAQLAALVQEPFLRWARSASL
jgi:acyl-CoA thioesterase-1